MSNRLLKQKIYSMLIGLGTVVPGLQANAQQNPSFSQDNKPQNKTEQTVNTASDQVKIYARVMEIKGEYDYRQYIQNFADHNEKAHYDPVGNFVVCITPTIKDNVAYHIATKKTTEDYKRMMSEFYFAIKAAGGQENLPDSPEKMTLDDVLKIKQKENLGLSGRKAAVNAARIKANSWYTDLSLTLNIYTIVKDKSKENTSEEVIRHELTHAENNPIMERAQTLNHLLLPQDYMLLCMADEMKAYMYGDRYKDVEKGAVLKQLMQDYKDNRSSTYLDLYRHTISDGTFFTSHTHNHMVAQQLNIKYEDGIVNTKPAYMDWDGPSAYVSVPSQHREYGLTRFISEDAGVYMYRATEAKAGEYNIAVDSKGKKYETNTLYNLKTNKPVLDSEGNKIRCTEDFNEWLDSHEIKIYGKVPVVDGDFKQTSTQHFEESIKEMFGDSADDALEILNQFKSTKEYSFLTRISPEFLADEVLKCKDDPITQERSEKYLASRHNTWPSSTEGLIDITGRFNKIDDKTYVLSSNEIQQPHAQLYAQSTMQR